MKQLRHAMLFRGLTTLHSAIGAPSLPCGTRALIQLMGNNTGTSGKALLRVAGPFIPMRDAYNFNNSGEGFTQEDMAVLRDILAKGVDQVTPGIINDVKQALGDFSLDVVELGTISLPDAAIQYVLDQITDPLRDRLFDAIFASIPGSYGRCGGIAFSALDFFLAGWPIDRTDTSPPGSGPLRDYIWTRLINSLSFNVFTFLDWYATLKIVPILSTIASGAIGAAAGLFIGGAPGEALGAWIAGKNDVLGLGGAKPLVQRTRAHLDTLAGHLRHGPAWPIGLIHDGADSPTDEHQVLATGLADNGDGTFMLSIWDNNWDSRNYPSCRKLRVDTNGDQLIVSCASSTKYDDIKGIICAVYPISMPPLALQNAWPPGPPQSWSPYDCN